MAVGFPTKTTYVNGDVFSAGDINDTNGTLNTLNPTAKGSIVSASGTNTPSRLAVGSNGSALVADSTATTGLKWDDGAWTTYTPTIFNGSAGNGTLSGRYRVTGKTCDARISFTLGSTSTVSSFFGFSLPVNGVNTNTPLGWTYLLDSGTQDFQGLALQTFTDIVGVFYSDSAATNTRLYVINATNPFTWTTNDRMVLNMSYEVA
jgi:hypothetical protein